MTLSAIKHPIDLRRDGKGICGIGVVNEQAEKAAEVALETRPHCPSRRSLARPSRRLLSSWSAAMPSGSAGSASGKPHRSVTALRRCSPRYVTPRMASPISKYRASRYARPSVLTKGARRREFVCPGCCQQLLC
jgi:hypothetical protein